MLILFSVLSYFLSSKKWTSLRGVSTNSTELLFQKNPNPDFRWWCEGLHCLRQKQDGEKMCRKKRSWWPQKTRINLDHSPISNQSTDTKPLALKERKDQKRSINQRSYHKTELEIELKIFQLLPNRTMWVLHRYSSLVRERNPFQGGFQGRLCFLQIKIFTDFNLHIVWLQSLSET